MVEAEGEERWKWGGRGGVSRGSLWARTIFLREKIGIALARASAGGDRMLKL